MDIQKLWAQVVGIVLIIAGLAGFAMGDVLLLFDVNALHNIVHLLTGAVFAFAGFKSNVPAKKINISIGAVYVLVTILGFAGMLDILNVNMADNFLHLALGLVSIAIGVWT